MGKVKGLHSVESRFLTADAIAAADAVVVVMFLSFLLLCYAILLLTNT